MPKPVTLFILYVHQKSACLIRKLGCTAQHQYNKHGEGPIRKLTEGMLNP